MIELTLSTGDPIHLRESPVRKFQGTRLPGGRLFRAEGRTFSLSIQNVEQREFSLCLRNFEFKDETRIKTLELNKIFRLETVLAGSLPILTSDNHESLLLPGQYHITDRTIFQSDFKKGMQCKYISIYYTTTLIDSLELPEPIIAIEPKPVHASILALIYEILGNPFDGQWCIPYYKIGLHQLLFQHGTAPSFALPGSLTPRQIATIYAVDAYLADNLNRKITLSSIAKAVMSNTHFIKRGYEMVFGVNLIDRLLEMRMNRAKFLLDKTEKPLKEIRELVGYETLAGFVTEFKKRNGLPPHDWRKSRSGC